ncbi:hypothetical protein ACHWQZ_G004565 [Mnemiopsis leidyi]
MSLICSLSNEVPEEPVISLTSKHIFEKRLLEKYIAENGTDPINGEPLSDEQIVPINTAPVQRPRPPTATSIPAILKILQDEWDACMLHSYTLRQQLQMTRQELSYALYQHDAACRVIARQDKEVTAAREALATLKPQAALAAQQPMAPAPAPVVTPSEPARPEPMEVETQLVPIGLSEEVLQQLQQTHVKLTSLRKKRGKEMPEGLPTAQQLKHYTQSSSHPGLHSASLPGILCLDLLPNSKRTVTGGADRNIVVFDKEAEKIVCTLKGHTKKVTNVVAHPNEKTIISASPDSHVRIWDIEGETCKHTLRIHDGPVTGLSLHPTGDYMLSCSADQHWGFSDIGTGKLLCKVADQSVSHGLTCCQFHPDGLIFGTGTSDSLVKIWDFKEQKSAANFPGHSGPISAIAFSENGYYLATSADDEVVKLWDLRKLRNFKTISLDDKYTVRGLTFDNSGHYLAVAGPDVRVYQISKQCDLVVTWDAHTQDSTDVRFGPDVNYVASVSNDRTLKFYSAN